MKPNYKRTVLVGLAFMSISGFWQLYNYDIPLILENTFGFSSLKTGVVMSADNVLAVFLLPLFGALSDRFRSPFGRRMPFIAVGSILAAGLMLLIPLANRTQNLLLLIFALGALLIVMSLYRSPAVALMPDVTPKPLRSKGNAVINLMGALGGIFAFLVMRIFPGRYTASFSVVAAFMVTCAIIMIFTVRENRWASAIPQEAEPTAGPKERMPAEVLCSLILLLLSVFFWFMAYNAVETAYSRYVHDVWGRSEEDGSTMMIISMLVATASYLPVGILSSKIGRKKVILGGVLLLIAGFFAAFLMPSYSIIAYIIMGVIGIGWAAINVNSYPMVVEMSKGSDVGKYTGLYYTFSMAAQILTPILSGALFDFTPWGYQILFPYAVLFSAAAFVTMFFVRHGDNRPAPKSTLELFEGED